VFGLAAAIVATLTAASYRRWSSSVQRLAPADRSRVLLGVAALPALAGASLVALAVLPKLLAPWLGLVDHCALHPGHAHICPIHPSTGTPGVVAAVPVVALAAAIVALGWRAVATRRALRSIAALGGAMHHDGTILVPSPRPFAFTVGLARPVVYVSAGLRAALSRDDLATLLEHERAHVRRRIGDRVQVAAALVRVARLQGGAAPWPSVAFAGGDVETRVRALLAPELETPPVRRSRVCAALGGLTAVGAAAASPLHHAAETVVAFLFQ
jgi:Zn-dependent protease with chaperone function